LKEILYGVFEKPFLYCTVYNAAWVAGRYINRQSLHDKACQQNDPNISGTRSLFEINPLKKTQEMPAPEMYESLRGTALNNLLHCMHGGDLREQKIAHVSVKAGYYFLRTGGGPPGVLFYKRFYFILFF